MWNLTIIFFGFSTRKGVGKVRPVGLKQPDNELKMSYLKVQNL
jgi:hypothetical protein